MTPGCALVLDVFGTILVWYARDLTEEVIAAIRCVRHTPHYFVCFALN